MMQRRLPLATAEAVRIGFLDASFADDVSGFEAEVARRATAIAQSAAWAEQLAAKQQRRAADEAVKPLATYRAEELKLMQRNFYGFDPGYHVARHHFVQKTPHSWTPRHLAIHREVGWQVTQPTTQPTAQQTDNPTIVISPENRDCVIARQPNK
jgi:putative two-component system hydrogenase maturation factor HypX/HoxX